MVSSDVAALADMTRRPYPRRGDLCSWTTSSMCIFFMLWAAMTALLVSTVALYSHHAAALHRENVTLRQWVTLVQLEATMKMPDYPGKDDVIGHLASSVIGEEANERISALSSCELSSSLRFNVVSPDGGVASANAGGPVEPSWNADMECQVNPHAAFQNQTTGKGGSAAEAPEESEDETGEPATSAPVWLRLSVGTALIAVLVGAVIAYSNLDAIFPSLVAWLQRNHDTSPASADLTLAASAHQLLAYQIDKFVSTNPYSKVYILLILTILLVVVGGLSIFTFSRETMGDSLWEALDGAGVQWTFIADEVPPGLSGLALRCCAVLISVGGMLITALMLGIVSEAISEKVDDLRKGKSLVLETGHSLILGWSDKLLPVVDQICCANASMGGAPIVILAEREKQDMEDDIVRYGLDARGSQVICRTGNPLLAVDLAQVSVEQARSVIVLADNNSPEQSDARAMRIILCLMGIDHRIREMSEQRLEGLQGHVVVELCDIDNQPLVAFVGKQKIETVVAHDIIGRLMIQCARQPGLAMVWESIMGFEGAEFYIKVWPELEFQSFADVHISFPDAVPLGVKSAKTGRVKINPPDDYVIQPGDGILVIAEDDDTYAPADPPRGLAPGRAPRFTRTDSVEKILFCGWRRDMDDMIVVLDEFVSRGSELWLYNEVALDLREDLLRRGGLDPERDLKNLRLVYKEPRLLGDLTARKKLEALQPSQFSSILILADESAASLADADSRALAALLVLRDIQRLDFGKHQMQAGVNGANELWMSEFSRHNTTIIISEILDSKTRHLIQDLAISEFVLSNELVSMMLAMVSEDSSVNAIMTELFTQTGNELYIHPACKYIAAGENLSFYEVMLRARQRNEIVIGYKHNDDHNGVLLNPPDKGDRCLSVDVTQSFFVVAEDFVADDGLDEMAAPSTNPAFIDEAPPMTRDFRDDGLSGEPFQNGLFHAASHSLARNHSIARNDLRHGHSMPQQSLVSDALGRLE